MIILDRFHKIRQKLRESEFLGYSYIIFLTGFFISPDNHLHRNYYYLFVIVPFLIYLDLNAIKKCMKSSLFQSSLIFLIYFLISLAWTDRALTSEEYYDQIRYFFMLILFLMATILVAADSKRFFGQIVFWLCLVALITSVVFILYFYASHEFPKLRVQGPFDYTRNPNQAAMLFGFVGILAFYRLNTTEKPWHRVFYWFVFTALVIYMLLSQSRGPLLAFICTVFLGLLFQKRWKEIGVSLALCILFVILVELGIIDTRSLIERGMADRYDIWIVTVKRLLQAPFLGEGYFTDVSINIKRSVETSPHNLLLLVMLKSGIVGGGLLLALVTNALFKSYRFYKSSGHWICVCLFVYFIVSMTVDSVHLLYKPSLSWVIFWLPIGLLAVEEITDEKMRQLGAVQ